MAADGDNIGRMVGRAVLSNDTDKLKSVSKRIESAQDAAAAWIRENKGTKISGGGDEFVGNIPAEAVNNIEQLRKDIEFSFGYTISVGVGDTLSEAAQSLLMAKLKGKNRIVFFDKDTKKEISRIRRRAKSGKFKSMEEFKIAESYLGKSEEIMEQNSCPYCEQTDGVDSNHCKMCHDLEAKEGEEACPFCLEDKAQTSAMDNDCPFCKEKGGPQSDCTFCNEIDPPNTLVSPDSNNAQSDSGSPEEKDQFEQMGMNPPIISKPVLGETPPPGQNAPMDVEPKDEEPTTGDAPQYAPDMGLEPKGLGDRNQDVTDPKLANAATAPVLDPEDNHSKEALAAIAQQIETEGTPLASTADSIDETDMPAGNEAEGNISRVPGFGQSTPGDIGLSGPNTVMDDEPDFSSILEEGLTAHSESIQKEKSIRMVSRALMDFKASKNILESMKMQAPQLYQASISILKAMIEMSSLLGLGQGLGQNMSQSPELGQVQAEATPEMPEGQHDWNEPFPAHPDQGGAPREGQAPSAETKEGIGQSIGKLSATHTTEHVARNTMPPGAINVKGQQKVIDPVTGKTRWIDRKQGMVQSPTGVPIKPPKRTEQ